MLRRSSGGGVRKGSGRRGPKVVVEVLPFLEALVEQLGVVDDDAFELAVEPFAVDPVGPFDLAVQSRGGGLDVARSRL